MASVVPTVLATDPEQYQQMYDRARSLSVRVHVDVSDGKFTDSATIGIGQIHRDSEAELDLHLMVERPTELLESALSLKPSLIIFHAESQDDLVACIDHCRELGVKAGLAILPQTTTDSAKELIAKVDHVLIFTGNLGHNGGSFNHEMLKRVPEVKTLNPRAEISVDGGINDKVASLAVIEGIDVLYSGAFLQQAEDPQAAFDSINSQIEVTV